MLIALLDDVGRSGAVEVSCTLDEERHRRFECCVIDVVACVSSLEQRSGSCAEDVGGVVHAVVVALGLLLFAPGDFVRPHVGRLGEVTLPVADLDRLHHEAGHPDRPCDGCTAALLERFQHTSRVVDADGDAFIVRLSHEVLDVEFGGPAASEQFRVSAAQLSMVGNQRLAQFAQPLPPLRVTAENEEHRDAAEVPLEVGRVWHVERGPVLVSHARDLKVPQQRVRQEGVELVDEVVDPVHQGRQRDRHERKARPGGQNRVADRPGRVAVLDPADRPLAERHER